MMHRQVGTVKSNQSKVGAMCRAISLVALFRLHSWRTLKRASRSDRSRAQLLQTHRQKHPLMLKFKHCRMSKPLRFLRPHLKSVK